MHSPGVRRTSASGHSPWDTELGLLWHLVKGGSEFPRPQVEDLVYRVVTFRRSLAATHGQLTAREQLPRGAWKPCGFLTLRLPAKSAVSQLLPGSAGEGSAARKCSPRTGSTLEEAFGSDSVDFVIAATEHVFLEGPCTRACLCYVLKSCLTLCDPTVGIQPARLPCPWGSPDRNTGVGFYFLLQEIFLTQGWNPSLLWLLHCRRILCR